jgi:hypothetical protein
MHIIVYNTCIECSIFSKFCITVPHRKVIRNRVSILQIREEGKVTGMRETVSLRTGYGFHDILECLV